MKPPPVVHLLELGGIFLPAPKSDQIRCGIEWTNDLVVTTGLKHVTCPGCKSKKARRHTR